MNTPIRFLAILAYSLSFAVEETRGEVLRAAVFTTAEGEVVEVFTITNTRGLKARILTWGATLVEMSVPDRQGKHADVTLGFDALERYVQPHPFFGSIVGRYANRIAGARFTLDGTTFPLAANDGANHLHGGKRGFDQRNWQGAPQGADTVRFTRTSPDGEEGYPGKLEVAVTYRLTEQDELRLDFEATTDQPTVVNLTNHTYWNLAGSDDVLGHGLRLYASRYTVPDRGLIQTGELRAVAGTPLDFTKAKLVGRDLAHLKGEGLPGGYDHNYVIDVRTPGALAPVAELYDPASGRMMRVLSTEPGVQLSTANGATNVATKGSTFAGPHAGLCLGTQHFPDSPDRPEFPTTVLRPGGIFRSRTIHIFSAH